MGLRCILQVAEWEFDVFGRCLMREKAEKADEVQNRLKHIKHTIVEDVGDAIV